MERIRLTMIWNFTRMNLFEWVLRITLDIVKQE